MIGLVLDLDPVFTSSKGSVLNPGFKEVCLIWNSVRIIVIHIKHIKDFRYSREKSLILFQINITYSLTYYGQRGRVANLYIYI